MTSPGMAVLLLATVPSSVVDSVHQASIHRLLFSLFPSPLYPSHYINRFNREINSL